jgi:hypothetical protein
MHKKEKARFAMFGKRQKAGLQSTRRGGLLGL